jgi:hypothetical protein
MCAGRVLLVSEQQPLTGCFFAPRRQNGKPPIFEIGLHFLVVFSLNYVIIIMKTAGTHSGG